MGAAVTYSDGTEYHKGAGEVRITIWKSPVVSGAGTMDSNDTVILPTITGKKPVLIACYDLADDLVTGDAVTATISTQTVTIDASGGTTNHNYYLIYTYI